MYFTKNSMYLKYDFLWVFFFFRNTHAEISSNYGPKLTYFLTSLHILLFL